MCPLFGGSTVYVQCKLAILYMIKRANPTLLFMKNKWHASMHNFSPCHLSVTFLLKKHLPALPIAVLYLFSLFYTGVPLNEGCYWLYAVVGSLLQTWLCCVCPSSIMCEPLPAAYPRGCTCTVIVCIYKSCFILNADYAYTFVCSDIHMEYWTETLVTWTCYAVL